MRVVPDEISPEDHRASIRRRTLAIVATILVIGVILALSFAGIALSKAYSERQKEPARQEAAP